MPIVPAILASRVFIYSTSFVEVCNCLLFAVQNVVSSDIVCAYQFPEAEARSFKNWLPWFSTDDNEVATEAVLDWSCVVPIG